MANPTAISLQEVPSEYQPEPTRGMLQLDRVS